MPQAVDVLIIGGGHNGLVAAGYLAKAGLKVTVLERRAVVGGACVTEEIHPGFHVSSTSYVVSMFRPQLIRELELERFGYRTIAFDPQFFAPFPDGKHLFIWQDTERTVQEIARFSKRDAEAYRRWGEFWDGLAEIVEPTVLAPPPPIADLAGMFRGPEAEEILRSLLLKSAADLLDEYFESPYVKAALVPGAIAGSLAGPMTPGTAFILGHHAFGEVNGIRGAWGYVVGGIGGLTQALARAAEHFGATVLTGASVRRILHRDGRAIGVELEDGHTWEAKALLATTDPHRTFLRLVGRDALPAEFVRGIERFQLRGAALKVNLALRELPDFTALPGKRGPQHEGLIGLGPTIEYIERAYDDAKHGIPSREPYLEIALQSVVDPTVAPPGQHTCSISIKYAPYQLARGHWDDLKERYGDTVLDVFARYAPNIREAVIARQVVSPLDMEREFGLTHGDVFHGMILPGQMFSFRPVPGWSQYRTPLKGLYLGGSGAHPGGGILGAPGYNAAQAILEDWREGKLH